jgi:hypothetical protein
MFDAAEAEFDVDARAERALERHDDLRAGSKVEVDIAAILNRAVR